MKEKNAQRAGFEPARGDPIRFQVELLNHSDIAAAARKSARRVNKNDNEKSSLHPGCAMSVVSSQCLVLGVKTLGLILIYYVFSITLTFYNRWMSKTYGIPLFMTIVHLVLKFVLAWSIRWCCKCSRETQPVLLPWFTYAVSVVPTAIMSALDIGISNWGLEFITTALYSMTKSSAIIFILIFAVAFRLEKPRLLQIAVILCISIGLVMFTFRSTQFDGTGFVLVLIASVIGGIRWNLAQILTQSNKLKLTNPIDVIYHLQPVMILTLLPIAVALEGTHVSLSYHFLGATPMTGAALPSLLLLLGALLAFGLAFSEYLLLSHTSSIALSVSGIFKEIIIMLTDIKAEGVSYSALNIGGGVICLLGIAFHVVLKSQTVDEGKKGGGNGALKHLGRKKRSKRTEDTIQLMNMNHANDSDSDGIVVFDSIHNRTVREK
ncbi:solute carrier family 35 member C2-like [Oscarella lobularis]|uniref:solute carrier family 35 member C2-like n=1 Tax=Oscarella lobularis TaxID=121494 RepID=UPI00331440FB